MARLVERGGGGIGVVGASAGPDYGIEVRLPVIPLMVPAQATAALTELTINTLKLALQTAAGYISDEASHSSDTGALAQSFGADPATITGGTELLGVDLVTGVSGRVFSSLPYAAVINDGRRPGAPISREGIDAIGLWAQRKLGLSADAAAEAKWAIAAGIVAQGIQGTGYFETGFNRAKPTIDAMFTALSSEIARQLTSTKGAS
jgi:hypothetical protein